MSSRLSGGNYHVEMGKGSKAEKPPENLPKGVISGETSGEVPETQARQERRFEALKKIEGSVQVDGELAELFDKIDHANPLERIGHLIDALHEKRLNLEASDSNPGLKRLRGNRLSALINQLRELI